MNCRDGENKKGKVWFILVSAICALMIGITIMEAIQIRNLKEEISEVKQELAWTIKDKDGEIISLREAAEQNRKELEEWKARIKKRDQPTPGAILQDKEEETE